MFLSPFYACSNLNYNILKRLYKLCFSNNKRYIYIWNDMIYVLCDNNDVIGISLKIMHYCGIKTDKIVSLQLAKIIVKREDFFSLEIITEQFKVTTKRQIKNKFVYTPLVKE